MLLRKDVVQVMNVKYKGEPLDCTNCSHSMMVVDIVYDFVEGKLEYLTVVDNGMVYPDLNYDAFCKVFYNVVMDLVTYGSVCNKVLRSVDTSVILNIGENITLSESQQKTMKYANDKIILSSKAIRLCRDRGYNVIPANVVFMIGTIYMGVGYMCYDKHFKGKRLGFDGVGNGVTQKDIFAKEFANIMMLKTQFLNCNQAVSSRGRNTTLVLKALQEKGFNIA